LSSQSVRLNQDRNAKPSPLTLDEIEKLEILFTSVFSFLDTLRQLTPLAEEIQYPKIPTLLSESLVVRLHGRLFKGSVSAKFGKPRSDIKVMMKDGTEKLVEVKATGESAFEFLGKRDITTDYLVWVHFGRYFHDKKDPITIYTLSEPSKIFVAETKLVLKDFLKRASGPSLGKIEGRTIAALFGNSLS
jgi:hypothetical protein